MKYLYASLALFLSLALTSVQAATYQPLVEATELNEVLAADQQLQIIDIRSAEDYAAGHIPGAYRRHTDNGADRRTTQGNWLITFTLKPLYVNSA